MDKSQTFLDIFREYATDEALETHGVWRDLNNQGARILVARLGNENFDRMIQEEVVKAQPQLDMGGELAEKAYAELVRRVMAKTVLLGWENLAYKGQVIPYSVEMAEQLLSHRDFRKVVERMASDLEKYRVQLEKEQGNG